MVGKYKCYYTKIILFFWEVFNIEKINIKGLFPDEMENLFIEMGFKKYRAEQVINWIYGRRVDDFQQMTNLPQEMRDILDERAYVGRIEIIGKKVSEIDGTEKHLYLLEDSNIIESVLIRQSYGNSICVSSQVGCRMGCRFCASTIDGLVRNLKAWEMLDQILKMKNVLNSCPVTHVVIMGSGEPLENYDEVVKFIKLVNMPEILNISYRRITLSTCGLLPAIIKLAKEDLPITLSVSLHAPNDEIRNNIMPINKKYPIDLLIRTCKEYFKITGRRVTFEYAIIKDVNNSKENARELSNLLKGFTCHVNIIPVNIVQERKFTKPSTENILEFKEILESNGINATVRKEKGSDIEGACGQLRYKIMHK